MWVGGIDDCGCGSVVSVIVEWAFWLFFGGFLVFYIGFVSFLFFFTSFLWDFGVIGLCGF